MFVVNLIEFIIRQLVNVVIKIDIAIATCSYDMGTEFWVKLVVLLYLLKAIYKLLKKIFKWISSFFRTINKALSKDIDSVAEGLDKMIG